jgi:hypothetical protein
LQERIGLDIQGLAPGDLIFDDAGQSIAPAEIPDAPVIQISPRPTARTSVGPIVGLSPAPLPFPEAPPAARTSAAEGTVARVDQTSLELWQGNGSHHRVPINLDGPPFAVSGPHQQVLTVLTARSVVGLRLDGSPAQARPAALDAVPDGPQLARTSSGPVWWTAEGAVVPLGAPTPP